MSNYVKCSKKYSICIAVLLMCLLFVGCQQDERNLSVFQLTVSDEVKEVVQMAYIRWYIEKYGQEPVREWIWDDTTSGVIDTFSTNCRYYGTFNDCIVWFAPEDSNTLGAVSQFGSMGNYNVVMPYLDKMNWFDYGNVEDFHVYTNGESYPLDQAYGLGLISKEDIHIVAERHRACREDYRSYGLYKDYVVWIVDNDTGEWLEFELGGSTFAYTAGSIFYATKNGDTYTLQETYEKGDLDAEDIAIIANLHAESEPWAFFPTLSDDMKKKIQKAYEETPLYKSYYDYYCRTHGEEPPREKWNWDFVSHGQLWMTSHRYYGTFENCIVWLRTSNLTAITEFEVAGVSFFDPNQVNFYVYYDGNQYTLQEGYEQGLLSVEDLELITERHTKYNNQNADFLWREEG